MYFLYFSSALFLALLSVSLRLQLVVLAGSLLCPSSAVVLFFLDLVCCLSDLVSRFCSVLLVWLLSTGLRITSRFAEE